MPKSGAPTARQKGTIGRRASSGCPGYRLRNRGLQPSSSLTSCHHRLRRFKKQQGRLNSVGLPNGLFENPRQRFAPLSSYWIMARSSASSKRACVSGLMPAPTAAQTNAQQSCLDGFTATIGTDPMAASDPTRPISRLALDRNNLLRLHS
jgi:hypothetical protein